MVFSYIYIISDNNDNFKVGVTKSNPEERMRSLQTGNPKKLNVCGFFKVPAKMVYKLEKQAHKEIRKYYNKRGEWFLNASKFHINVLVGYICDEYLLE